ncbi:MAG TPA: tetratricopeptide repeat protein [Gemmatimonadaceae bacterium]|nr:tetratricopeptide repeat protein [Gemmatimonadaceae bacterium]
MRVRGSAWALAALLACTDACFATKNDVRLLQDELRVSRAATAHADSARAAQADSIHRLLMANQDQTETMFAQSMRTGRNTADSLAALSGRMVDFQARTKEALDQLGKDLVAVAALNQASANALADLQRGGDQAQQRASGTAGTGTDSTAAVGSEPAIPAPGDLIAEARGEFNTHSCSTARGTFSDFLQYYPTDRRAVDAQSGIAETYATCEGNQPAADSVYQIVIAKYPGTDQAATALYRHAKYLCTKGNKTDALAALKKIVSDYPLSTVKPDASSLINQADPCA